MNCVLMRQKVDKLFIYDRAITDYIQWEKWKKASGIYIVTKEKENSRLEIVEIISFGAKDPVNFGIVSDEKVRTESGIILRRVKYKCPDTGEVLSFLTNLQFSIRPGVIACLYKARWDIEKLFDVFKNKLDEKKAWASSDTAKTIQANFLCLAHNLTLLMNNKIEIEEKVKYDYDAERKTKILKNKQDKLNEIDISFPSTWETCLRVSQITIKFFRWLRACFRPNTSWHESIANLKLLYEVF